MCGKSRCWLTVGPVLPTHFSKRDNGSVSRQPEFHMPYSSPPERKRVFFSLSLMVITDSKASALEGFSIYSGGERVVAPQNKNKLLGAAFPGPSRWSPVLSTQHTPAHTEPLPFS